MTEAPSRAHELISALALRPHPEGGHYGEVFRSRGTVTPAGRDVLRPALTSIHFLLSAGERSRWHRVLSDEVWHHLEGAPLELLQLAAPGEPCRRVVLGPVGEGASPIAAVPGGLWQAARSLGGYTLAGCTVAPGFDFADFSLLADAPDLAGALRRLAPELAALL